MGSKESFSDYKSFCKDEIVKMFDMYPEYTTGEILHCIGLHLKKDTGKKVYEATDSEIYRAIRVANIVEECEVGFTEEEIEKLKDKK